MSDSETTEWLTRKQASAYLAVLGYNLSAKSLSNLASNENAKKGPAFYRFGWQAVRYKREDLQTWVARQMRRIE